MTSKCLYQVLGLPKGASVDDVKKAYRNLAKELHPDKNPEGEERFKQIASAYETLSDPTKKRNYDHFGVRSDKSLFSEEEISGCKYKLFEDMYKAFKGPEKTASSVHRIPVTLEDLFFGKKKPIILKRAIACKKCKGKGCQSSVEPQRCKECHGTKFVYKYTKAALGMVNKVSHKCSHCNGEGIIFDKKFVCTECKGTRVTQDINRLELIIQKGMSHQEIITFEGAGDQEPDKLPGDLEIILDLKPHDLFKKTECDLWFSYHISLTEALCGFSFSFKHLDGRDILVSVRPGSPIQPGSVKKVEGEGMPYGDSSSERGNLYILFFVDYPTGNFIDEEKLKVFEELLGPKPTVDLPKLYEEVNLLDLELKENEKKATRKILGNSCYVQ